MNERKDEKATSEDRQMSEKFSDLCDLNGLEFLSDSASTGWFGHFYNSENQLLNIAEGEIQLH